MPNNSRDHLGRLMPRIEESDAPPHVRTWIKETEALIQRREATLQRALERLNNAQASVERVRLEIQACQLTIESVKSDQAAGEPGGEVG